MSFNNTKTGQCTSLNTGGKWVQDSLGGQNKQRHNEAVCRRLLFREQVNKRNKKGQVCSQAKLMVVCGYN